ncbi:MAG: beta-lactamase [Spirochaetes bacterium]|nr:MAG: beta-lactamase [Spirochaetota bacterium]
MLRMETPRGAYTASAGLAAGADETWHFRIASVSKTFTAAAIMLLDQEGRLDIDDFVTAMIPGSDMPYLADSPNFAIPNKNRITIHQLLSHRAGVFDVFNNPIPETSPFPYAGFIYNNYIYTELKEPDHSFTAEELAGVVAANALSFGEPGTLYHYSDTGFTLLAKIVERVAGMSYDRFLEKYFWIPMGLAQTSAPWNGNDYSLPKPYLKGYVIDGDESMEFSEDNMSSQVGPGNIISTAGDLARWVRTLLSGRGPLSKEQVLRMRTVPKGNATYALGLGNTPIGVGHTGAHPGYVNFALYNPDDDVAVVIATPFIDYSKLSEQLSLMLKVGKEARALAGYYGTWEPRREE